MLHHGPWEDFYRDLTRPVFSSDIDLIAYHHPDGLDFVISFETGDDTAFELPLVTAEVLGRLTVHGNDAVVTSYGTSSPMRMVSWREADGTIVRLGTTADPGRLLGTIGSALEPVDADVFAAMVEATDVPEDQPLLRRGVVPEHVDISSDGFPDDDQAVLAGLRQEVDGVDYRAAITRDGFGVARLETLATAGVAGSGTAAPLTDLQTLILDGGGVDMNADGTPVRSDTLVAGLVPPDFDHIDVFDRDTGEPLRTSVLQLHTAVDETSWRLLFAVIDLGDVTDGYRGLEVHIAAGERTIRYWV